MKYRARGAVARSLPRRGPSGGPGFVSCLDVGGSHLLALRQPRGPPGDRRRCTAARGEPITNGRAEGYQPRPACHPCAGVHQRGGGVEHPGPDCAERLPGSPPPATGPASMCLGAPVELPGALNVHARLREHRRGVFFRSHDLQRRLRDRPSRDGCSRAPPFALPNLGTVSPWRQALGRTEVALRLPPQGRCCRAAPRAWDTAPQRHAASTTVRVGYSPTSGYGAALQQVKPWATCGHYQIAASINMAQYYP